MVPVVTNGVPVKEASVDEGRELVERLAMELLGQSADEFLAAWDAGEYRDTQDPKVVRVAMLLPFVR